MCLSEMHRVSVDTLGELPVLLKEMGWRQQQQARLGSVGLELSQHCTASKLPCLVQLIQICCLKTFLYVCSLKEVHMVFAVAGTLVKVCFKL